MLVSWVRVLRRESISWLHEQLSLFYQEMHGLDAINIQTTRKYISLSIETSCSMESGIGGLSTSVGRERGTLLLTIPTKMLSSTHSSFDNPTKQHSCSPRTRGCFHFVYIQEIIIFGNLIFLHQNSQKQERGAIFEKTRYRSFL